MKRKIPIQHVYIALLCVCIAASVSVIGSQACGSDASARVLGACAVASVVLLFGILLFEEKILASTLHRRWLEP